MSRRNMRQVRLKYRTRLLNRTCLLINIGQVKFLYDMSHINMGQVRLKYRTRLRNRTCLLKNIGQVQPTIGHVL